MDAYTLTWSVKVLVWAFLLFNSFRLRLIGKYRLVFAMILVSMASSVLINWLAYRIGTANMTYAAAWVGRGILTEAITAAVLLRIYRLAGKLSIRRDWHLVAIPVVLVAAIFLDERPLWFFARVVSASNLIVTYLGLAAIARTARCRNLILGWNLKMVLMAITVPSVFEYIINTVYFMGMPLSRDAAQLWLTGTELAIWIILAMGMLEYSPPVYLDSKSSSAFEPEPEGDSLHETSSSKENLCTTP